MNFLLDENLPPAFCQVFKKQGYEARHVYDVGLGNVEDSEIVSFAEKSGDIIVTNDLDFSRIMALSGANKPSIISFRLSSLNQLILEQIIQNYISELRPSLENGAIVTINSKGIRIRDLPLYQ